VNSSLQRKNGCFKTCKYVVTKSQECKKLVYTKYENVGRHEGKTRLETVLHEETAHNHVHEQLGRQTKKTAIYVI
jgi:hypothetical protein